MSGFRYGASRVAASGGNVCDGAEWNRGTWGYGDGRPMAGRDNADTPQAAINSATPVAPYTFSLLLWCKASNMSFQSAPILWSRTSGYKYMYRVQVQHDSSCCMSKDNAVEQNGIVYGVTSVAF
jgi:hypothetical protein